MQQLHNAYAEKLTCQVMAPNICAAQKHHIVICNTRIPAMAVIDTTRAYGAPRAGFGAPILKLVAAVQAWNATRATRKALSQLSDRELDDIGLTRADIDNVIG